MNKPPSARVLATIYSCSERSIRNYRADGAPLGDPAAMWSWWSSRKNMPRAVAAKGLDAIREAFTAVVGTAPPSVAAASVSTAASTLAAMEVPADLPAGAEHELRWLAALAVEARHNLIRARTTGDPVGMKQALDSYLKITEGLRKFDNQVAADRRDSGEVITRAQIQNVLTGVIVWTRRGIEDLINGCCLRLAECESPQQVYPIIAEGFRQSLGLAVEASMESQTNTPAWVRDAMVEGL